MLLVTIPVAVLLGLLSAQAPPAKAKAQPRRAPAAARAPKPQPDMLPLQVMLDKAGFSPGVIDGRPGSNTQKALDLYTRQGGDPNALPADALLKYTLSPVDADGPYVPEIPGDLMQQSKLPALSYRDPLEALAERFHTTPALLQRLNPGVTLAAGETILVPNVDPLVPPVERLPAPPPGQRASSGARGRTSATPAPAPVPKPDVLITVSKAASALSVTDDSGRVVFYAPVTTGSEHDPLPIGEWKVNGVQFNPTFRYNPNLFWDADPTHSKATIPSGPNNPVGLVWIDLTKEHYGIHGTPEPATIGRSESHGCVRLTNWDALKLAGMVKPGTRVLFTE
jgi:lipoprotein-anchoring transpeptidase ErfK/SrfK